MMLRLNFLFIVLLLPLILLGQLYDSQTIDQNGIHYFGLGYFPASWQSGILKSDAYAETDAVQRTKFNILSSSLRLNFSGSEKMLSQFRQDYPNAYEAVTIDFDVANYYFNNEKYRYALKWFSRIEESQVPKMERSLFNFNKGYTLFSAKKFKQSKPYFEKVRDHKIYESEAHYYLGHIAYQLEDFDEAVNQFSSISDPTKKENLTYFQADMNFRLGRFEKAIELGKSVLPKATQKEASEISKIIGESYFNLSSYSDAIPYLEVYKGKKDTWENTDFYQLGFAYHQLGNFDKAMGQFNKILGQKNALAQNAYYYLADSYIKTNQKAAALNAFKSASEMDFDPVVQEDASLNYAKLSYEVGNPYEGISQVLIRFINKYPKNGQLDLMKELLINSYTKSGNYKAALEILQSKGSFKNNKTLQRVMVLQAIQDFKSGLYTEASLLFEKSIKIKEDKVLEAYSWYWLGRAQYERNLFDQALDSFKRFNKHPMRSEVKSINRLSYDMGYIYFKLGEYEYALKSFEEFNDRNSTLETQYQRDTFLRMGDCEFALKRYWPAMEHYNTAIALKPSQGSYASYQKAISYGFVDRSSKKISTLKNLIENYPKDALVDDALFELASTYSRLGENSKAISTYDALLLKFSNSPYLAKARLNKGLILYNDEDYVNAQKVLEEVAIKYKRYAVAEQAVRTLREIALDQGTVGNFSQWVKSQNLNTFSDIELEKTAFTAAEKQFLKGNTNSAKKLLKEYLENFPQGAYRTPSTFYLAEIYFDENDFEEALKRYQLLVQEEVSNFTEKALVRVITLLKNKEDGTRFSEALTYLEQLDQIASFEENKRFASLNLMLVYYQSNQFKKTIEIANTVLNYSNLDPSIKWDALKLKARSAISLKDFSTAKSAYMELENAPQTNLVAEALFFKAEQLFTDKKHEESNKIITKIAGNSNQSGIWNSKALLLLAKNYYALDDAFQAIYILESLLENFNSYTEIVDEAKVLIEKYKAEEAVENRSINGLEDEK
ncbi:MAG: tetratricopeptide repeat protein [Flavobacteriaceae bacterium]